jgi:multiple sugar transport system permease protein
MGRSASLGAAATYLGLSAFGVLAVFPMIWIVTVSLQEAGGATLGIQIPIPPSLDSYVEALTRLPLMSFFRNSAIITLTATLGTVLSSSLVGFSLARLRWPGRDAMFGLVIATTLMPYVVTLVPSFVMFKWLGWLNTYLPLIVPAWTGTAFYVFLLRQFMRSLPVEMDEAARVDGASNFTIYWRIVMPLSGPVLAAVAIFAFVATWNDFLHPLIYLQKRELRTVAVGLFFFQNESGTDLVRLMAASTVTLLPVLAVFAAFQRYFIQGIIVTGLKG